MRWRFDVIRIALLIASLTLLSGCVTSGAGDVCAPWRPIRVAKEDQLTRETAQQILAHDLTGRKLCGW
jgi:hypothetical protein